MPLFNYRAIDTGGRSVRGQLSASNDLDLFQRLKESGLELITSSEVRQNKLTALFAPKIKHRDLIQMCVHLQQLNAAGVSLIEGLADVRDSTEQPKLRDLVSEIHSSVAEGKSLSQAFGAHPRVFGPVFTSLISAGEESGNLSEAFLQLVKHLKWTEEVTTKIKKATRYPSVMLVVILGLFFFMMTMVVPEVIGFLKGTGQPLPGVTLALVATSDFVINFWYVILITPVVLLIGIRLLMSVSEEFRYRMHYLVLRMPKMGDMIRKISLARFAHFFAVMFQSGVPILQCIETATKVVNNLCLSKSLENVQRTVQQGNAFSAALKNTGEFPSLVIRMVKIGEDSGNLSETLENVTSFYDTDVNDAVDGLIAMMEPMLTMIVGALMAWIIMAIFGPMYDSFSKMGI
ncbi:MAG: type II secretion system F family protein [Alphaproteobacteria bacterium]|nr:type II secretion system F family protein [Alphaproteobacteria bacterium]